MPVIFCFVGDNKESIFRFFISIICSYLKDSKWKKIIPNNYSYDSKRVQDNHDFFRFIIRDNLKDSIQYIDEHNKNHAINYLNEKRYDSKNSNELKLLFEKISTVDSMYFHQFDYRWIRSLNNLDQYSFFIKNNFEKQLSYFEYKIILEKLLKTKKVNKKFFYLNDGSLSINGIEWFYEKINHSFNNLKNFNHVLFNKKFINNLFLYDKIQFFEKIINLKYLSKNKKHTLLNLINTKNHLDSLILNPNFSKYYEDQSIIDKIQIYAKRSDFFKNNPGLRASYLLSFKLGIKYLPIFLSLFKKIKYTHLKDKSGKQFDALYRTYELPKKSGGNRIITVPHKYLKSLQRIINEGILINAPLSTAATGFRKNTSIVDNAKVHKGNNIVVNVDISNFFPNTKKELIWLSFHKLLKNTHEPCEIKLLTEICSYNGALPMGAPTSPAISNLVLKSADKSIIKVAKRKKINYSRYADDLTFSSNSKNSITILPFVKDVLNKYGYHLDPKKTNIFRKGRRQCVTGLVVNQKVSVPRPIRKRLRASVHNACMGKPMHWNKKPMLINELMGRLAFLNQVHEEEARALKSKLSKNKLI